jgi:hypothetical protein
MSDPMTAALWFLRAVGIAGPAAHVSVAAAYSHVAEVVEEPSGLPPRTYRVLPFTTAEVSSTLVGMLVLVTQPSVAGSYTFSASASAPGLDQPATARTLPPRAATAPPVCPTGIGVLVAHVSVSGEYDSTVVLTVEGEPPSTNTESPIVTDLAPPSAIPEGLRTVGMRFTLAHVSVSVLYFCVLCHPPDSCPSSW